MRLYEVAVVLHPDLEIDLDNTSTKIEKIIEGAKGKIVKRDNWGKRKLAYKINKQDWGIYIFYQVELDPQAVSKIENTLRITEEVMRYLVVSLDHIRYIRKSDSGKKPSQKTEGEENAKDDTKTKARQDNEMTKQETKKEEKK